MWILAPSAFLQYRGFSDVYRRCLVFSELETAYLTPLVSVVGFTTFDGGYSVDLF